MSLEKDGSSEIKEELAKRVLDCQRKFKEYVEINNWLLNITP